MQVCMETEVWETTFNAITDLISIHDVHCRIVRCNRAFLAVFGEAVEPADHFCFRRIHGLDAPIRSCPHLKALSENKPVQEEHYEPRLNAWFEVFASPLYHEAGKAVGIVHVMRDITDRKKAEEERLHREKLKSVIETAGAACHELNQPLQALMGFSDLLLQNVSSATLSAKWAERIRSQCERMGEITHKLNHITHVEVQDYLEGQKIVDLGKSSFGK